MVIGDWGLVNGDWGLVNGDWGLGIGDWENLYVFFSLVSLITDN
jgi:hypothetical protein